MDSDKINELCEKHEDEYLKFDRIPPEEKLAEQDDLCGLLYLYNRMKDKTKFDLHAEHDIVYLPDIDDLVELTEEDIIYLTRCGIHFDSEFDCFADFV